MDVHGWMYTKAVCEKITAVLQTNVAMAMTRSRESEDQTGKQKKRSARGRRRNS
jgi:hypothetical protein